MSHQRRRNWNKSDIATLNTNLTKLEVQISKGEKFDERLKELETRLNTLSAGQQQNRNR
jgi:hypothetical protein